MHSRQSRALILFMWKSLYQIIFFSSFILLNRLRCWFNTATISLSSAPLLLDLFKFSAIKSFSWHSRGQGSYIMKDTDLSTESHEVHYIMEVTSWMERNVCAVWRMAECHLGANLITGCMCCPRPLFSQWAAEFEGVLSYFWLDVLLKYMKNLFSSPFRSLWWKL